MKAGPTTLFLIESVVLAGVALWVTRWVYGDDSRAASAAGVLVPAVLSPFVFAGVARGLEPASDPNAHFVKRWGATLLLKLAAIGVASMVLLGTGLSQEPYLMTLGVAFQVFSLHQVVRLVQLADRVTAAEVARGSSLEKRPC